MKEVWKEIFQAISVKTLFLILLTTIIFFLFIGIGFYFLQKTPNQITKEAHLAMPITQETLTQTNFTQ